MQDSLNLIAGVNRPRTSRVQLDVRPPVLKGLAWLFDFLIGQRNVVVRVGVCGRELECRVVCLNGVDHAASFIEHITEIKIGQRIASIDLDGATVMLLSRNVVLAVVVKRPHIYVGSGMVWVELQNALVSGNGLSVVIWVFLQRNPARKKLGDVSGLRLGLDDHWSRRASLHALTCGEIKHELPSDRLHNFALMSKRDAMSGNERARFEQRILHSGHLLLHGFERLPNHSGTYLARAQVANLFDLQ